MCLLACKRFNFSSTTHIAIKVFILILKPDVIWSSNSHQPPLLPALPGLVPVVPDNLTQTQ